MEKIIQEVFDKAYELHQKWLNNIKGGARMDFSEKDLTNVIFPSGANMSGADMSGANMSGANMYRANMSRANMYRANMYRANMYRADMSRANMSGADMSGANMSGANMYRANMSGANMSRADMSGIKNLIKIMGVEPGNYYWKRLNEELESNGYYYQTGRNGLRKGEKFADDERVTCSYPGLHFASKSWCALNYSERPLEVKIRIPEDAKINEPWATDGKASASAIEIIQVIDTRTGEDVTKKFKNRTNGRGELKKKKEARRPNND